MGFEIYADDNASANLNKASGNMRKMANDVELAQVRVAKATDAASKAIDKFGSDSIQAREAAARLTQAEIAQEAAANRLAKAQKNVGNETEETAAQTSKLRAFLAQTGATMAGVFGAQAVTAGLGMFTNFARSSVDAASNLGESMNAVQKVFGENAKEITDWGASTAASFGLSQRAFQEFATPLGASLKNAGLGMQDVTRWTLDLTQRAADMASVFNTTVPDALEAIQAGLRGEADPLERYGVGLSDAAVKAQALAETHKQAESQLTNTEIATARLNLIMKQTSATAGDFRDTSTGYANAQRIATAEMENAKAKLGQGLLPIMAKVTSVTASAVGGFASLPGPVQAVAIAFVAVGGAAALLLPRIAAAKAAMAEMGVTGESLKTKMGGVAAVIGKLGAAVAVAQFAGMATAAESGARGVDTTTRALLDLQETGTDSSGTLKELNHDLYVIGEADWVQSLDGALSSLTNNFASTFNQTKERLASLDATLSALATNGKAEQAAQLFDMLSQKAKAQGTSVDQLRKFFPQYQNALDSAANAQRKATTATDEAKRKTDALKSATDQLTASLDANKNMLLIARGGETGYWAAVDQTTAAVRENGRTLDVHTAKGRANRDALDTQARAALGYLSALQQTGAPTTTLAAKTEEMRARLIQAYLQFSNNRGAAVAYANSILGIPKQAITNIVANTAPASTALNNIRLQMDRLNGRVVRTYVVTDYSGSIGAPRGVAVARAAGGVIPGPPSTSDSVPAWLSTGEYVVNARATQAYRPVLDAINAGRYAGGGYVRPMVGTTQPTIRIESDGSSFSDWILNQLRGMVRVRGGNVQFVLGRS